VPQIQNVVVFGDSLSDIGKKWTQPMGGFAYYAGFMTVSPTGRFSDCRNWTDFMFEEAGGLTLVVSDANASRELSQRHMRLLDATQASFNPKFNFTRKTRFTYVNYAEGGACGDTPFKKSYALGTFKDQVDKFEANCRGIPALLRQQKPLGNILFIIWFGANDLYTADRPAAEMGCVANQIAVTQRGRLAHIAANYGISATFIFVDLARPLTSVRYAMRLKTAKNNLRAALTMGSPLSSQPPEKLSIQNAVGLAKLFPQRADAELKALEKQMAEIRNLESGVTNFNAALHLAVGQNGDRIVKIGSCITEDSVRALVRGHHRLKKGASPKPAAHISARNYDLLTRDPNFAANITTIDEVHPSDVMYRLIWHEIRNEIYHANCTFGALSGVAVPATLSQLAQAVAV
jgi:phospholipase/lecithinase/hemolysin